MHAIAYLSPFSNTENPYIARQHALLGQLGYEVRPLSIGSILRGRCAGLGRTGNVVMVHWLENRLFRKGRSERGLSARGLAEFALYSIALGVSRARVVYFVHDHAVHDVAPRLRRFSVAAIRWLRWLSDARVVHDPTFAERYDAAYLPHPLYDEPVPALADTCHESPAFTAMGAIRPYKALHELLESWPTGVRLSIAGKGDPAYVELLRGIVRDRGLEGSVSIDARFLSDEEFAEQLSAHDVLVLPHLEGANLVSGAFFAGVGRARLVLARDTPFIGWARQRIPGVFGFSAGSALTTQVEDLVRRWPELSKIDGTSEAVAEFGEAACLDAYGRFLGVHGRAPSVAARREPSVEG
ncbi:hypothetical protein [Demequina sp. NBRC 110054]|uniref:hypothetical protein n=1 Tax=Demequina sp. NBRC 110054 TaxID=1570343 RepID=UPI000A00E4CA|nr:hypothetical protein [Demequina sp. NBRC 110054]